MKTKLYAAAVAMITICGYNKVAAQAAQDLSNLTSPTNVNVNLLPDLDNKRNLGNVARSWNGLYLDGAVFLAGKRFLADKAGIGAGNTVVGTSVLHANTSGHFNTGTGDSALFSNTEGYENTATGYHALYTNTFAHANSAFGASALAHNIGHYNTAIGSNAMANNSTGSANVAIGTASLTANTIGEHNTAGGVAALSFNTIGFGNTAFGSQALNYNIRGSSNVAIGVMALYKNENTSNLVAVGDSALLNLNGYHCTAIGSKAGMNTTTGTNNTYVGYHAGITVTTGHSNTLVGYGANVSEGTLFNATALGNETIVNASNKVRIGNSSVTSIGGQVGWTSFSDERIKNDVKENVPGLKFINLLRPVMYQLDIDKEELISAGKKSDDWNGKYDVAKIQFTGFLAQEVEAAAKKIGYEFSGVDAPKNKNDLYGLRYADFVVPLVKAVQELDAIQNAKFKIQNEEIAELKKENVELKERLSKIESMLNGQPVSSINAGTSISLSK